MDQPNTNHQLLPVVAIDGPAGSGKSSVAKRVAATLALPHIDTGAMYRALTVKALQRHIPISDAIALHRMTSDTTVEFTHDGKTLLDSEDVSDAIRKPEISANVSAVSAHATVREQMVRLQRNAGRNGAVLEGRDIGTVVFPDARLKVYLIASDEVRARRRQHDLQEIGVIKSVEDVIADLRTRDKLDSERETSPLRCADDARVLDTSDLTIKQVVDRIVEWASETGFVPANPAKIVEKSI